MPSGLLSRAGIALLTVSILTVSAHSASAQEARPAIRLQPQTSTVNYDDGRFAIFAGVQGVDHHGSISYDEDRDTIPDRSEPSNGVGAFELLLTFNPDVVRIEGARAGPFIGSGGRSSQCFVRRPQRDQYAVACLTSGKEEGAQGSGTLAMITFRPVAQGSSDIALAAQLSGPLGDSISVDAQGGHVDVHGGPLTPPPDPAAGEGGSGDPQAIGGGSVSQAGGNSNAAGGSGGSGGAAGDANGAVDPSAPNAGTGFWPADNSHWMLAALLALAGAALVLTGARGARSRKS